MSGSVKLLLAAVLTFAAVIPLTIAQRPAPSKPLPQIELPNDANPPVLIPQANTVIEGKIRKVLSGDANAKTGDPILDDILGVIKQRGSILKGSTLGSTPGSPKPKVANGADHSSERFRAAELLLRTSRSLEKLGPLDASQRDLINKMRIESKRLLNSAVPDVSPTH